MMRIHAERAAIPRARLALKTYLKMILSSLVTYYASYSGKAEIFHRQEQALDKIRPLFRYLEENCGTSIQIKQAARVCGMSESHFMSIFKDVTGLSFLICQDVGFCDQSYFGAVFRKIVGITPAEYRRRFRNSSVPALPQVHQDLRLESQHPAERLLA
jgi:AraC-like DNA-binding protein